MLDEWHARSHVIPSCHFIGHILLIQEQTNVDEEGNVKEEETPKPLMVAESFTEFLVCCGNVCYCHAELCVDGWLINV